MHLICFPKVLLGGSSCLCYHSLLLHKWRMWRTFKIIWRFKIKKYGSTYLQDFIKQSIQLYVLAKNKAFKIDIISNTCIKWVITLLPFTHWTCGDLGSLWRSHCGINENNQNNKQQQNQKRSSECGLSSCDLSSLLVTVSHPALKR